MFVLIIFLMSISLIGIIAVQVFWISNAIEIREKQFSNDVSFALAKSNEILYKRDIADFSVQFMDFFQTKEKVRQTDFSKFVYEQINTSTNETFRFSSSGVYENTTYKGLNDFYKNDSILIASVSSKNDVYKVKKRTNDTELSKVNPVEKFTFYNKLSEIDKQSLEDMYHNIDNPIYKRLSKESVAEVLTNQLKERGIEIGFKFGVYSEGVLTKVKSNYYKDIEKKTYTTPLFTKDRKAKDYQLHVVFPDKDNYIFSDIGMMLLLSVFFTVIIMLAFASSLYQLIRQKKISAIKTDFINNMTHEFKTPIATINLALDSIKNPEVIADNERVLRYVSMIKEENKRMHTQVENVLRISSLQKKQLDIAKKSVDFYEIVEDAVSHVSLLLHSKSGTVEIHQNQVNSEGLGNEFHLTNVFVNVLENAIKYSDKAPKIDIFVENSVKSLTISIKDQGIGMSKSAQKHAFDKFYREQKGNVHDVKGHGLGLAYVKEIVENHQGTIFVKSEKGKGSIFTISLPIVS